MQLQTTGGKDSHMTAMDDRLAEVLNTFSNRAFMQALTERDHAVMSEL